MKRNLLIAAALLWTADTAWGQVAAPSLIPGSFTATNPAVIKWAAPSDVGLFASNGTVKYNQGIPEEYKYTVYAVGIRLVGDMFAGAAQAAQINFQDVSSPPFTIRNKASEQSFQAAAQLGDSIALGIGQSSSKSKSELLVSSVPTASQEVEFETVTTAAGMSLRLGEWFFVAAAAGQDKQTETDVLAHISESATRNVTMAGAGIRTGGQVLFHAEVYSIDRANFSVAGVSSDGSQTTGVTVEAIAENVLLAYNTERTTYRKSSSDKSDSQMFAVGWAPQEGISVVARILTSKETFVVDPPGTPPPTSTGTAQQVSVTWRW